MHFHVLGKSTLSVSGIAFGCMSLGKNDKENAALINNAIDAGINGYLLKDDQPEILLKAVETVMKGEQYLSEAIAGRLLRLMQHTKTNPIKPQRKIIFSDIEVAVMKENCKGLTVQEIGCKLNMKERNVRSILKNLHKKLDL